jgi:hypothetical protein
MYLGERSIVPDIAVFTWNRIPLDEEGDIAMFSLLIQTGRLRFYLRPKPNEVTSNILHCLNAGCQMGG